MDNSEIINYQRHNPEHRSPGLVTFQILGIILRLLGFVFIGSSLALIIVCFLYGVSTQTIAQQGLIAMGKGFVSAIQGLTQTIAFILLPVIYIFFFKKDLLPIFNFKTPHLGQSIVLSSLIILFCLPIVNWAVDWNKSIDLPTFLDPLEKWMQKKELEAKDLTETIAYYSNTKELLLGLLVMALIPAISEELMFRGIIQNEIKQYTNNIHIGIWMSAFIFSFLHLQFYGFFPRMMLGVTFGYLYYWSGSLFIPMLVHFLNNALTFLLLNFYKQKAININPESTESIPWYSVLISLIIFAFLLVTFKKISTKRQE